MPPQSTPTPHRRVSLLWLRRAFLLGFLLAPLSASAQQLLPEEPLPPPLSDTEIQYLFLDLTLKLEDYEEAERIADMLLARNGRDPQALAGKFAIALQRNEARPALEYAERLRAAKPGPEAEIAMVGALNLNKRFDEALNILDELALETPKGEPFPYLLDYGYTYYGARKLDKARDIFVTIRSDERFTIFQREEAGKQLANLERDQELIQAYDAIEQRDLKGARKIADRLVATDKARRMEDPSMEASRDVLALQAILAAEQNGETAEAVRIFERLKVTTPAGKTFPYASAYAIQLLDQGRFEEADAAAMEASRNESAQFTPEGINDRWDTLRAVSKYSRPTVSLDARWEDRSEGTAARLGAKASIPLQGGQARIGVEVTYNDPKLNRETRKATGIRNSDYYAAFLTARYQLTDRFYTAAAIGAVGDDLAYRISLGWLRPSKDVEFKLTYADGHRPTDTLQLEALEAQERRVSAYASVEIPAAPRFRISGEAFFREIDLDADGIGTLGHGWGVRAQLEYLLYRNKRTSLSIAYRMGAEEFDFSSSARKMSKTLRYNPLSLVEDNFRGHGLSLLAQHEFIPGLTGRVQVGAAYRFDTDEMVYDLGGGIEYWFDDLSRLEIAAAYYTSGKAAEDTSGFFEGRVGIDMSF